MSSRRAWCAVLIAALVGGCATPRPAGEPWRSAYGRAHPLTGRIWDVARARFVTREDLLVRLATSRFVLLGEKHDNPDHHRLQAEVLRALIAAGRRPAVAFEMFTTDQAPAIARYVAAAPADAAGLGDAVDWKRSGWPDWTLYKPIADAALAAGLPIVAANVPLATARAVSRGDLAARPGALVARYGLDRPPAPDVRAAMVEEISEAHCGHAPERLVADMIEAQRVRDAQMAESLLAGERDGAVLVAGAGHVRSDYGVPAFLALHAPGARVASVVFTEVEESRDAPDAYAARRGGRLPFDYVWFTPRVDDEDPCERFRPSLERLRPR